MQLLTVDKLGMLLGLSFFLGLSFEGFYWNSAHSRPGGIRTFPLISLSGAALYALEPQFAAAFCVGLLVLGVWLFPYYQAEVSQQDAAPADADGIMVPLCNVVAYLLGPVALGSQPWLAVGLTVVTVLLLRARDRLHALAEKIPGEELITLAQFLVLIGVILPLLPNEPVSSLTPITPFQVWLAVVVVSSLSYGSYLLQKLLSTQGSVLLTSLLGGLYSSTATTVVLSRRLKQESRQSSRVSGRYRAGHRAHVSAVRSRRGDLQSSLGMAAGWAAGRAGRFRWRSVGRVLWFGQTERGWWPRRVVTGQESARTDGRLDFRPPVCHRLRSFVLGQGAIRARGYLLAGRARRRYRYRPVCA